MKLKHWQFTFIFIIVSMVISGCGRSDVKNTNTVQSEIVNEDTENKDMDNSGHIDGAEDMIHFPDTYEDTEDELVQFQAKVQAPESMAVEIGTDMAVSYISLDFEQLLQEFLPEGTGREKMVIEQDTGNDGALYSSAYNDLMEMGNHHFSFYMQTEAWKKIRYAIYPDANDPNNNMEQYEEKQTFSFGEAEEVFAELEEKMRRLGLRQELQCTSFYADYPTLQSEYIPVEGETSFNEEDSGYYYSAVQLVGELPVYACYYYGSGIEGGVDAANITAYIDGDGLEMVRAERIITEISYGEEKGELLTLAEIAAAVKKRFSMVITDNKVVVKELRLCYMTDPINQEQLRLIPLWMCNYEVTDHEGNTSLQQFLINAVTAEEVIYSL